MAMDYDKIKKTLQGLIEQKKKDEAQVEVMRQKHNQEDRNALLATLSKDLADNLRPTLQELAKNSKISAQDLRDALKSSIDIQLPEIRIPDVIVPPFPTIRVPTPQVTVNVPEVKIPTINVPQMMMPDRMNTELGSIDRKNPLPVRLMDEGGKPFMFTMPGGGKSDFLTIKGFGQSAFSVPMDSDGQVKVAGTFTASASASTYVIPGNREGTIYNGDNPLPVVFGASATQAVNVVDSSGIAYSGTNPVPVVFGASATQGVNIVDSSGIGYSGTNPVPITGIITGITNSTAVTLLNGDGIERDSWLVSDVTASIKSALIDSSGVQYSGTNQVPIKTSAVGLNEVTNDVLRVVMMTGVVSSMVSAGVGLNEVTADILKVYQVSSCVNSVYITGASASTEVTILNGEGIARDSWLVSGITNTIGTYILDSTGIYRDTFPISSMNHLDVDQVSGANWSVSVSDIFGSVGTNIVNPDNRLKVELPTGASGLTDTELRASSLPVWQASGSIWSTAVIDIFGSTAATNMINADNRLKVSVETGGSGITDTELRAISVPVEQVSGSSWSTYITGANGSIAATILNGEGLARSSWDINVSGAIVSIGVVNIDRDGTPFSNTITGITNSTAATILNGDGTTRDTWGVNITGATGSLAATILNGEGLARDSWLVSGVTASIAVVNLDRDGNPVLWTDSDISKIGGITVPVGDELVTPGQLRVYHVANAALSASVRSAGVGLNENTQDILKTYQVSSCVTSVYVTGSSGTTAVVGSTLSDVADDGSAPVKTGGIARTANPTATADGDTISFTADDLGRQVMRPLQVRDLIATAYVAKATGSTFGTETTLLAATAGSIFDLIYLVGTNDSDAALSVDIRGVTAGNILLSFRIPANGTAGIATPVPLPQTSVDTGNAWTIDLPDVTGTNVNISALFSKEV
jgi:hypothetical protein